MADGAAPAGCAPAAAAAAHAPLRIGILGFGTFGQFLAKRMLAAGHAVLAWNRSDQRAAAARLGVEYFSSQDDFCEQHPEVVILCTSILSLERIVAGLPVARLRRSTLFVDVASVKSFPRALMLARLPPEADLLCSHPMFGPDSGKVRRGWRGWWDMLGVQQPLS
jgi:arogenate dehydrogenase (NADP+)